MLPALSKVAERVILTRYRKDPNLLDLNPIPDEQFVFREGVSTDYLKLGAVFLNIFRAFDTVWHTEIIYKIIRAGFGVGITILFHEKWWISFFWAFHQF